MNIIDHDLLSIQEARILIENAREAQKVLAGFSQEKLDEIVDRMAEEVRKYAYELAEMSMDETDYGKVQDKYLKNRFVCEYVPAKLKDIRCVGIINEDKENKTMDIGVPMGVIVALSPATSPVSTTIYKALIAIKSGNAIVFSPHPRAKQTIRRVLDILIKAAEGYGLPAGALSYLSIVTVSGTKELMNHKETSLVINTGVPGMLDAAYASQKPVIYGGNGNGPVFIERTADIKQAVKDIIASKTFDNGVVSASEQSVVVDGCIAKEVKEEFKNRGAYFMTDEESEKLVRILFTSHGGTTSEMVGKTAFEIAKKAGFSVPESTTVLISERSYVCEVNPYAKEKLCPVLAYYIEDDWKHACEKCIELLLSQKNGHTLVIHSKDEDVIRQFALKKPVGRVLVNTPASLGSIGATTNLFPALTLGSGSAGHGMTSDNVSPMNLVYIRKVGYGVRRIENILDSAVVQDKNANENPLQAKNHGQEGMKALQSILEEFLKELK